MDRFRRSKTSFRLLLSLGILGAPLAAAATSPTLTQCGIISGLTPDQRDFAASIAFMSDARRQQMLGSEDMLGQVERCASQIRLELCSAKIMMGLLKPGKENVGGAVVGAAPGVLSGSGIGAMTGGSMGWSIGGIIGSAAQAKECDGNRQMLTQIADRAGVGSGRLDPAGSNLSYQRFVVMLRSSIPNRISMDEAEKLAKAADATRRAVAEETQ